MFGSKGKDAAFFDAFAEHASQSVEASKLLVAMLEQIEHGKVDDKTKALAKEIKDAEKAGDKLTHETVKRLRENWITPLDRVDIHDLISHMDDVLDFIEAAAERMVLFEVHDAPAEALELARILARSCATVAKATGLLRDMPKGNTGSQILELCHEMEKLEHEADGLHRKALADLYATGNEPLRVMKWRDIFDSLESATDCCEDVANVIEGVVIEYA